MIETITAIDSCFGCTACQSICPTNSISFVEDEKGFLYPYVKDSCVNCRKCIRICPANTPLRIEAPVLCIAMQNTDSNVLSKSTSGGVFSLLAKQVLSKSGAVYGVSYDEQFNAVHIRVTDECELERVRGSKYVQSMLGNTFRLIAKDLGEGTQVLFTGTPCQVDGLLRYLSNSGVDTKGLISVAVLCHGVPSPRVFKDHIRYIESMRNKRIVHYSNREKVHGWHEHNECAFFEDGTVEWRSKLIQNFKDLFYQNTILRESCYTCPYAKEPFVSDITMGDFWGIEYLYPMEDDNRGTSIVFANSDKGKDQLIEVCSSSRSYEVDIVDALLYNHHSPCLRPDSLESLWDDYRVHGYSYIVSKYAGYNFFGRVRWKIHQELRRFLVRIGIKRG